MGRKIVPYRFIYIQYARKQGRSSRTGSKMLVKILDMKTRFLVIKGFDKWQFNSLNEAIIYCLKNNWSYEIIQTNKPCCYTKM